MHKERIGFGLSDEDLLQGRLLHYYPSEKLTAGKEAWCGWHTDVSSLTGILPLAAQSVDHEHQVVFYPVMCSQIHSKRSNASDVFNLLWTLALATCMVCTCKASSKLLMPGRNAHDLCLHLIVGQPQPSLTAAVCNLKHVCTCSTAQHSTAQHSTAQHSTAQHSTAQHSALFLLHIPARFYCS